MKFYIRITETCCNLSLAVEVMHNKSHNTARLNVEKAGSNEFLPGPHRKVASSLGESPCVVTWVGIGGWCSLMFNPKDGISTLSLSCLPLTSSSSAVLTGKLLMR